MGLCFVCENAEAANDAGMCDNCAKDKTVLVGTRRVKPKPRYKK